MSEFLDAKLFTEQDELSLLELTEIERDILVKNGVLLRSERSPFFSEDTIFLSNSLDKLRAFCFLFLVSSNMSKTLSAPVSKSCADVFHDFLSMTEAVYSPNVENGEIKNETAEELKNFIGCELHYCGFDRIESLQKISISLLGFWKKIQPNSSILSNIASELEATTGEYV